LNIINGFRTRCVARPIPSLLSGFAVAAIVSTVGYTIFAPAPQHSAPPAVASKPAPEISKPEPTPPPVDVEGDAMRRRLAGTHGVPLHNETPEQNIPGVESTLEKPAPSVAPAPTAIVRKKPAPPAVTVVTPPAKSKKIVEAVTKAGAHGTEMQMTTPEPVAEPAPTNGGDFMMAPYQTDDAN
jgi:hypothetical protein